MLCDGHGDARYIDFLETVFSKEGHTYIAGDSHKRDGVHVGSGYPCHQVSRTRTACGKADAHFACSPGISVRRMGRSLLVGGENMPDFITMLIQLIIYIKDGAARVSEHSVNALLLQTFHYNFCTC